MSNVIYIATSLDGYIADKDNSTKFLGCVPNPQNDDLGIMDFFDSVDCLLMGSTTYQTVLDFEGEWPYPMPVFVMSTRLKDGEEIFQNNVTIVSGEVDDVLKDLRAMGYVNIYVDGGSIIQQFLSMDLIDEMIITTLPVLIGGGTSLFGILDEPLMFDLIDSKVLLNQMVSSHYKRKRL